MRAYLCGALAAAALAIAACQQQESDTAGANGDQAPCKLSVGWDPWEPYQYEAADGSVQGLDIEITALLARDAGCTLDYVRGNWLDLLHQLRDGRVDVLLAATVIPEREKYARFSRPYRQETFALYVLAEKLESLSRLDLEGLLEGGRRIGYTEGYYYGPDVNALATDDRYAGHFVAATVVELNYARLMDGRIDALLDDPFVASSVIRRKGWSERVARHPLEIASGQVSLMFSKTSVPADVVQRFDESLARLQQDGTLKQLIARYAE